MDEFHVPAHGIFVGDVDVGGLAHLVLTSEGAAHRHVQEVAAVSAGDDDAAESLSEGFEHHLAQHHHAQDEDDVGRRVVDAVPDGGARLEKLAEGEVGGEEHLMHPRLFVGCVFHAFLCFVLSCGSGLYLLFYSAKIQNFSGFVKAFWGTCWGTIIEGVYLCGVYGFVALEKSIVASSQNKAIWYQPLHLLWIGAENLGHNKKARHWRRRLP